MTLREGQSRLRKILLTHPIQRGTNQVAIWLEESGWNPGKWSFESLDLFLKHTRILHGVLSGDGV